MILYQQIHVYKVLCYPPPSPNVYIYLYLNYTRTLPSQHER
uniref:Uncharacterized protein n=1 Tax=Anguilla anguilla TaxID=7936 RepID=A0A0E9PTM5_ANGAN